jgi:hypothetical protein
MTRIACCRLAPRLGDLEFPEMPRSLALRGAELICASVNWPVSVTSVIDERGWVAHTPLEQTQRSSFARTSRRPSRELGAARRVALARIDAWGVSWPNPSLGTGTRCLAHLLA